MTYDHTTLTNGEPIVPIGSIVSRNGKTGRIVGRLPNSHLIFVDGEFVYDMLLNRWEVEQYGVEYYVMQKEGAYWGGTDWTKHRCLAVPYATLFAAVGSQKQAKSAYCASYDGVSLTAMTKLKEHHNPPYAENFRYDVLLIGEISPEIMGILDGVDYVVNQTEIITQFYFNCPDTYSLLVTAGVAVHNDRHQKS